MRAPWAAGARGRAWGPLLLGLCGLLAAAQPPLVREGPRRGAPTTPRTTPAGTRRRSTTNPSTRLAAPAAPRALTSQLNAAQVGTRFVSRALKVPTTSTGTICSSASCADPVTGSWASRRLHLALANRKPSATASRECSASAGTMSVYTASRSLTAHRALKLSSKMKVGRLIATVCPVRPGTSRTPPPPSPAASPTPGVRTWAL